MPEVLLGAALGATVVLLLVILSKRRREWIRRRYAPMSDEEFMSKCTPGTDPNVALRVRRIIAERLGVDDERIHPSTRFTDDFGTD